MASRKANKGNENTGNGETARDATDGGDERERDERDFAADVIGDGAPEGFRRLNALDGARLYFKPEVDASLRGVLLGRFKRLDSEEGDEDRHYFQIRLTRACKNLTNAEGESVTGDIGMVVHLDERSGLRDLEPLANLRKPQEVIVQSIEKIKLKRSTGSFWRWNVYGREAPALLLAKLGDIVKKLELEERSKRESEDAEDPFA